MIMIFSLTLRMNIFRFLYLKCVYVDDEYIKYLISD